MERNLRVAVLEPSDIVFEGLRLLLGRPGCDFHIRRVPSLAELIHVLPGNRIDLLIINPVYGLGNPKQVHEWRNEFCEVRWLGLLYSPIDRSVLSLFDGFLSLSDDQDQIIQTILSLFGQEERAEGSGQESLSFRETEVLKLLALGNSNKEIADRLNISIHTVITHRKNISQKTGIKSAPGLTVYAVVNKIISLSDSRQEPMGAV